MSNKSYRRRSRAFTTVELIIGATLSLIVMAGVLSAFLMYTRSAMRLRDYADMESQTMRGLEMLARDLRMTQSLTADLPQAVSVADRYGSPQTKYIRSFILTVPNSTNTGTSTVTYTFSGTSFTRKVGSGTAATLISNIDSNSGYFGAYNLLQNAAVSDLETSQVRVYMTLSPGTKGNYVSATKRVISARFVLRNKGTS